MKDIKWAVLGTGVIANEMAQALIKKGKSIYSVANRTHQKAVEFAKKYNIDKVFLKIRRWMLYISQLRTILIMNL
jgi:predicted dehydrogenase